MRATKYLVFTILVISLVSCNDFLTEKPRSNTEIEAFYQSEDGARQAINGIYSSLRDADVTGTTTKTIPHDLYKLNSTNDKDGLSDFTYGASNDVFRDVWRAHYACIKNCNYAVYYIEKNKDKITNYKKYVAQAKGVRAYLYFNLVRWFGDVPLIVGKPTLDISPGMGRVTRTRQDSVFGQIIADFKDCANYSVPKDSATYSYGMMSKEAAHGFLAKVYLWLGSVGQRNIDNPTLISNGYFTDIFKAPTTLGAYKTYFDSALIESKLVIASGKFKLTAFYPDLFSLSAEATAKEEVMFSVQANKGDDTGSAVGQQFGIQGSNLAGGSSGSILSTNYHRTIYEDGDSIRRLWNCPRVEILYDAATLSTTLYGYDYAIYRKIDPDWGKNDLDSVKNFYTSTNNFNIGKFRRYPLIDINSTSRLEGMDEPILRYADILLIYAEAYNEVNNGPGSYTSSVGNDYVGNATMSAFYAVNLVRKRARTYNSEIVHKNAFPRVLKYDNRDLVNVCVPDWKPSFYGNFRVRSANDIITTVSAYADRAYSSDYQAFREEILWERGREFVAETTDRWCDLVRRNKLVKQVKALLITPNPFEFSNELLPANSCADNVDYYHMLLPIPQAEIDVNRNLTQNPKY